jgi:hypothetical protein
MLLEGRVESAKVGMFFDGVELAVIDKGAKKLDGTRMQYKCVVTHGISGLEEMRVLGKQWQNDTEKDPNGALARRLQEAASKVPLPQEDQMVSLLVYEQKIKNNFATLRCELLTA